MTPKKAKTTDELRPKAPLVVCLSISQNHHSFFRSIAVTTSEYVHSQKIFEKLFPELSDGKVSLLAR